MDIKTITLNNFGAYHAPVKTLFLRGKFGDKVTRGFYGEILTKRNVSLEHLNPHSKGGRNNWGNLVLSSKTVNHQKGTKDLAQKIDIKAAKEYLAQFANIHIPGKFDGNAYVRMIKKTLADMRISLNGETAKNHVKPHIRTRQRRCFHKYHHKPNTELNEKFLENFEQDGRFILTT